MNSGGTCGIPREIDGNPINVMEGDSVTRRPLGKNWAAYFDSKSRGSIPARRQPPLDD